MKLVTAAEMTAIEAAAFAAGATPAGLMENAGRAVSLAVGEGLGGAAARRIVVLVGPGNNGGDGLVAARYLYAAGAEVFVYLLAPRPEDDANYAALLSRDIDLVAANEDTAPARLDEALGRADGVLDAVLGTGRRRPLAGAFAAAFDALRAQRAGGERHSVLFALDLPSGVDPDGGGVDGHACAADLTLALGFAKIGLHTLPGAAVAGRVEVLDIGLDAGAGDAVQTELLTAAWAASCLPPRPADSHKGSFGRVLIVAGSRSFSGAAVLAALGALRSGAGIVTVAAIEPVRQAVAALLPEATHLPLPEADDAIAAPAGDIIARALPAYRALLIGPGLGGTPGAQAVVRGLLGSPAVEALPVVVDADALNALARQRDWPAAIKAGAVLTPHLGELARLTGESIAALEAARLESARRYARQWRQTVVLKGAYTVVAGADGGVRMSPFATAALATAGTGDVLAGTIAGLMAQSLSSDAAAGLGVYLHGAAALEYEDTYGESGMLASDLAPALARVAARLRHSGPGSRALPGVRENGGGTGIRTQDPSNPG